LGVGREKRALVLAQNRARAILKKRSLSQKERSEFEAIVRTPLPEISRKAA